MTDHDDSLLDDSRLTAYALDQLPEAERSEIEQLLEKSPAARKTVAEIRQLGAVLRKSRRDEPYGTASPVLREAVTRKLASEPTATGGAVFSPDGNDRWSNFVGLAIAASLLIGVTTAVLSVQHLWTPTTNLIARNERATGDATSNARSLNQPMPTDEGFNEGGGAGGGGGRDGNSAGVSPPDYTGTGDLDDMLSLTNSQPRTPGEMEPDGTTQRRYEYEERFKDAMPEPRLPSDRFSDYSDRHGQAQQGGEGPGLDEGGKRDADSWTVGRDSVADDPTSGHRNADGDDDFYRSDDGRKMAELEKAGNFSDRLRQAETTLSDILEKDKEDKGEVDLAVTDSRARHDAGPGRALGKPAEKQHPTKGWRRSRKVPNTSRLMVGEREELTLAGMQVNVQIDGFRARVLLDCYFHNHHDRQLEGTFQLRLPDEASLYFFAFGETAYGPQDGKSLAVRQAFFDVGDDRWHGTTPEGIMDTRSETWKQPKQARMVPRVKAAHAYRETVRRRVDPALVEWSGAGVFSAKVFPLMPRKVHRVVVGYDVNLLHMGKDFLYRLDLPDDLGEFTVDINVNAPAGGRVAVSPEVKPFTTAGRAYFHYDLPQQRQFTVRLQDAGNVLLQGDDPDTGPHFAASFEPPLPEGEPTEGAPLAVFLVDTSLSSNPEKFNVWLSLLEATLAGNRDSIRQFAVLFFNIEQHWWREEFVDNTDQNVQALLKYCRTLALEGATDLSQALRVAAQPAWEAAVAGKRMPRDYFLMSDGAVTWGERNVHLLLRALGGDSPVFAYRTGLSGTDVRTLTQLTRQTGGAVFSVAGEADVAAAARAHRQRPWQLVDVSIQGGSDLMLAGRPEAVFPGQQLLLVGRGTPPAGAAVTLKLKRAGQTRTIATDLDRQVRSDLASRVYGQVAVVGLEELGDASAEVATSYVRHFRVTGRTCSLLMLESEADYQQFDIKPEDDAFVVKRTVAGDVILQAEDKLAGMLGDPKASFVAWLDRLQKMPELHLQMSPALKLAIDSLPSSAFEVNTGRLQCDQRNWEPIPEPLREMLSVRSFGYDEIMREAERRHKEAGAADALKALSSLIEFRPGDLVLARDVGYSALDMGLGDQAYHLLRRVAEARPYEPQTYLAIAHCLGEMGNVDLAMLFYEIAVGGQWDNRFGDFKEIANVDYFHFLRRISDGKLKAAQKDFAAARLDTLSRIVDMRECDVVVTVMWNTDGTDVDLHVIEPSGEECYYQHRKTRSGGQMTQDVTDGFGPEMYTVRTAPPGPYLIRTKYFASDQNRLSTRTRVIATVYEDWGRPQERRIRQIVTLNTGKEMTDILTVKRGGPKNDRERRE